MTIIVWYMKHLHFCKIRSVLNLGWQYTNDEDKVVKLTNRGIQIGNLVETFEWGCLILKQFPPWIRNRSFQMCYLILSYSPRAPPLHSVYNHSKFTNLRREAKRHLSRNGKITRKQRSPVGSRTSSMYLVQQAEYTRLPTTGLHRSNFLPSHNF